VAVRGLKLSSLKLKVIHREVESLPVQSLARLEFTHAAENSASYPKAVGDLEIFNVGFYF